MKKKRDTDIDGLTSYEFSSGAGLTRRSLLQRAGWTMAAAAIPYRFGFGAADNVSPIITTLSTYMSEARNHALPDEVVEKAKHHIIDTFAAMISGAELPPGAAAFKFASANPGDKIATVVASKILCGPMEAALANGVLAHSDETDDSNEFSQSHPGAPVVPATLAVGEKFGIDGTHFLRAVTLGYDIGPRMTISLDALTFRNESHRSTHSIAGDFGAAAAAGCAASLNAQQMRWLIGYTTQQSSGIAAWQRDTDHIQKAFVFAGMTARNGVTAALLVQLGWNGVEDTLSGADNFYQAYGPKGNPALLIEELGKRYEIARTNIKKWTVGSPIQAPLDALENIRKKHPFEADQVKELVVREAHTEARTVNNREMPDICLQHMMAVMLIDKTASFHAAHDKPRMEDPAILRQRAKVKLVEDEELQKLEPQRIAIVEVTLTDGTKLTERVENVRGTVDNPMPRKEIVEKAQDLMAPVIGAAQSKNLINTLLEIEKVKDIRELRPLLQHG